ncbi:MAG: 3'-5' exoribonuclease [Herminiimonas sp.]|nr:3'-5' exoribonuclease [Herminiimonas sp.]
MPQAVSDFRLSFVDLETTGTAATSDRITEIGIVEVDENGVREWSSLVNPGTPISPFIQSLTGISNDMVADAPSFDALSAELHARLDGRLFIAHNARFDHGFLKNEFKRSGHAFKPAVLCTVKLSRKLYPGFARHNLDALVERHKLPETGRHRALADARLIWQFWQSIRATLPADQVELAIGQLIGRPSVPSQLDASVLDTLPATHGVYLFYGENDLPLYVGKANNIRRRVLSHFSSDHLSSKELQLSQQLRRIEWVDTAGEIGALLKEAMLIKTLSPAHNAKLRRNDDVCAWRLVMRAGALRLALVPSNDLFFTQDEFLYGPFSSKLKATNALRSIADENQLCPALLGLDKTKPGKPCFASQVKRCLGACCGKEANAAHTERVLAALKPLQLRAWPYPGPVGIPEGASYHIVNRWGYIGTADSIDAAREMISVRDATFDRDVYQILRKYIRTVEDALIHL